MSAIAAIGFDILEALLHRDFSDSDPWLLAMKYALYAAFGFFFVRGRVGFPNAVAVIAFTAFADVAVGWWVANTVAFSPVSGAAAQPDAVPTAETPGFVYAPADMGSTGKRMALAIIRYSAVGGVAAALATATRIRKT